MYNNTKKAWVLSRDVPGWRFGEIEEQNKILASKSKKEGFSVIGYSDISEPINRLDSMRRIQNLITAAKEKKIDALFEVEFLFIYRINCFGGGVYDIAG